MKETEVYATTQWAMGQFPLISSFISLCLIISADYTGVIGHWGKGEGTEQLLELICDCKALG